MSDNNFDNKFSKSNFDKTVNKPELLAPAGNIESFYGVLRAGADAVYLAGSKFGARAYADNFTESQLISCIRFAHLYHKKVYLTVNTLIKDSECEDIVPFIKPLYNAGLDGVIIQDIGVFSILSSNFPGLELHASTQMTITGPEGALFAKELGACRIVPARELSLNEIKEIKKLTGLQLECFIHGAMCYSYSGQCLFSSVIGKRSGNRGKCAQPCRLPYCMVNQTKKEIYPLSLKDMCTIDALPELINSGIDSFKIEGRMKKPEYAAGVTSVYRKYIDQFFAAGKVNVTSADRKLLENLYIRSEISEGYYHKYNGKDMVTYTSPSYNGASDALLDQIRANYLGERPSLDMKKYHILFSASFVTGSPAVVNAQIVDDNGIKGTDNSSGEEIFNQTVTSYGDKVEKALSRSITTQDVAKQLGKLGDTVFYTDFSECSDYVFVSEDAYYPLKGINELRRDIVSKLEKIILNNSTDDRICVDGNAETKSINMSSLSESALSERKNTLSDRNNYYSVLTNQLSQLEETLSFCRQTENIKIKRIYITEELFFKNIISPNGEFLSESVVDKLSNLKDTEVFIACPYIRRKNDKIFRNYLVNIFTSFPDLITGLLVRNWEDYKWYMDCLNEFKIKCATDFGMYVWNRFAVPILSEQADTVGLPLELNSYEHLNLISNYSNTFFEKMIYGRYPLMQSVNCIRKTTDSCLKNNQNKDNGSQKNAESDKSFTLLKDRTGRYIPVYCDCMHCRNTVYNSVPLSLKNDINNKYFNTMLRIEFTNEDNSMVESVLKYYICKNGELFWEHTGGFEKQSTE